MSSKRTNATFEPRRHLHWIIAIKHAFNICNKISWVVVGNLRHPAGTDTVGTVNKDHGNDGTIPFRFDALVVIVQVSQKRIIVRMEDQTRHRAHHREDITRAGCIFASLRSNRKESVVRRGKAQNKETYLQPSAKLTVRQEKVEVV